MFDPLIRLVSENALLLLFVITGVGHLLGRIRFGSFNLGVSAILFTGLGFGALHRDFRLPSIIYQFGLVLFVYTLGLSAGPAFFTSLRRRGLRATGIAVASILFALGTTVAVSRVLQLPGAVAGGVFVGSLTSTPALAAALEFVSARAQIGDFEVLRAMPVVGYSLSYPISVLCVMLSMHLAAKVAKVDVREESQGLEGRAHPIINSDVEVIEPDVIGRSICELFPHGEGQVVVSRLLRGQRQMTVDGGVTLQAGDVVTLVGPEPDVNAAAARIGRASGVHPSLDRSQIDLRRIIVSSKEVAGRSLRELDLRRRFGATISRIRRGDVEVIPTADFVLEQGDQVRVVAPRDRLEEIGKFLGNSYKNLGEIDIISISLGIGLGLLVGAIPIPLPGGFTFQLGFAGGPLMVALLLGYLGRTRTILWVLPYNVNVTLRELGMILFLAGIGTQAGNALTGAITSIGPRVLVAATVVTLSYSLVTLFVGHKLLKIPLTIMYGLLAGVQTQSASVAFANERTGSDQSNLPYAMVYPTAMVLKILLVQVLIHLYG